MLKTEKQTIMEFLGKTDVKKKFMNVLAEKLQERGAYDCCNHRRLQGKLT